MDSNVIAVLFNNAIAKPQGCYAEPNPNGQSVLIFSDAGEKLVVFTSDGKIIGMPANKDFTGPNPQLLLIEIRDFIDRL